jgi:predicted nucleic acid-binding protein
MDTRADVERAARLSHGEGLSMADALVLRAALDERADRLYTNDRDLLDLEGVDSLDLVEV